VAFLRIRGATACAARLREHAELALMYRRLTRIALDAPVAPTADALRRKAGSGQLDAVCEQLRFGPLTRSRLRALAGS
jgi:hypothetical protein